MKPYPFRRIALLGAILLCQTGLADSLVFQAPSSKSLDAQVAAGRKEPLYATDVVRCEAPNGLPGVQIPVGGRLVYEGAGNAFIPAGTLGFWWRPDAPVQKKEATVLSITSLQRFYFARWLSVTTKSKRLMVTLYHGDGAEALEDAGAAPDAKRTKKNIRYEIVASDPLKNGEWIYVTVTWDMRRGLALYLNGKLVRHLAAPWFFSGNVNHISLAAHSSSYTKAAGATFPQSFADVQVHDRWLSETDVARLVAGEKPRGMENFSPMLKERVKRLGLRGGFPSPEAKQGEEALWLQQVNAVHARDVKRSSRAGLDGDLGRAWPMYQGYSNSGQLLTLELPPRTSFDTVQALASGPMEFFAVDADGKEQSLLQIPSAMARVQGTVSGQTADEIRVKRGDGMLFNLGIFKSREAKFPGNKNGWQILSLQKGDADIEPLVSQEFASYDTTVLKAAASAGADTVVLPAGRALHLFGPSSEKMRGLQGIALDLATPDASEQNDFCLMVIDPLTYERRTAMVNFHTVNSDRNGRVRMVLDLRDLIYKANVRPWIILYSGNDLKIDLSASSLGFQWSSVEDARPEFFSDQQALIGEAFQEISESRPWNHDPEKIKLLRSLRTRVDFLRELDPQNARVDGYYRWINPRQETPEVRLPEVPENVPAWAFHTERAKELFRRAAHWWIDNRQSETGEFGAPDGINDDTDLIQDWLAIDLMNGPDQKIRDSVEKVAEISWNQTTTDGVSNQITDTLHIYEWGINAQTLAFLLNYGDPVYFERLLRFASRYQDLMTEACAGGHLHFKSWYFGANRIITEGIYGRDLTINALLLQPAMLLAWYNGDAKATDLVARWTKGMIEHIDAQAAKTQRVPGVAVEISSGKVLPEDYIRLSFADASWAAYKLTGDTRFRDFAGRMIAYETSRKPLEHPHVSHSILGAYLRETGDSKWDALWRQGAEDQELWKHSLHNGNYRDLDYFYAAWLRSGDDKWLDAGTKLALYHMIWSLPMLTEAEATTDRVWLPQRLANQMTLGGLSILRNQIFPKHAVSWENATGAFAPLVRQHSREKLEMEIHNLEDKPITMNARIWGLDAGIYEISTKTASRNPSESPSPGEVKEREIVRYSLLPLELPAASVLTVTLTQKKKLDDVRARPDLAISHLDATYDAEAKKLTCVIHNIGAKSSGDFRVAAFKGDVEIAAQNFESLPAPENFRTHKMRFSIPVDDPATPLRIRIFPDAETAEITDFNNETTLTPEELK